MPKRKIWKEQLLSVTELPRDIAFHDTILTVIGQNEMSIENYRSILKFHMEEILVQCVHGRILIKGKNLRICRYTPEEMNVKGIIQEISINRQG